MNRQRIFITPWSRGALKRLYGMDKAPEVFLKALKGKDVIKVTNKEK